MATSGYIFLSYRREDSRWLASRLATVLAKEFGKIFMDVETIGPGVRVSAAIRDAIEQSDVLLVVIGNGWLNATKEGRRRLDDPNDWVVREIEYAFYSGVTVIPVLVDDAAMPLRKQLPVNLGPLADLNASTVRFESFEWDASRLVSAIRAGLKPTSPRQDASQLPPGPSKPSGRSGQPGRPWTVRAALAAYLLVVIALGIDLILAATSTAWAQLETVAAATGAGDSSTIAARRSNSVFSPIIFACLYVWLGLKMAVGRHWARVCLTLMSAFSATTAISAASRTSITIGAETYKPFSQVPAWIGGIIALIAIVFLYAGPSNSFFREAKLHRERQSVRKADGGP